MITFNTNYDKYQLTLEDKTSKRLFLLDTNDLPLLILHANQQVLTDLEVEIAERYQVREMNYLRTQKSEKIRNGVSLGMVLLLFISTPYQERIANRLQLSIVTFTFLLVGLLGLVSAALLSLLGRKRTAEQKEGTVVEDMQLRNWIVQHCQP